MHRICEPLGNCLQRKWWELLTVEPAIFLAITSTVLTSVVEQAYLMHLSCTVDLGYDLQVCRNLSGNITIKRETQEVFSTFTMFNEVAYQAVPLALSLFIGAWSDRRGRKIIFLMGLLGKLWYAFAITVGSTQENWSVYMVLLTCTLPASFTGFELALNTAAFDYVADVSSEKDRTFRLTLLEVFHMASVPIGLALGNLIFYRSGESYTIIYAIYTCGVAISMVYSWFRLKWTTTPNQTPLYNCCAGSEEVADQPNCCTDFFQMNQFLECAKVALKERPNHGRAFLYLLAFGMFLFSFQREEVFIMYLYTQLMFDWDVAEFSSFRIYVSSIYVVGTLVSLPLMHKYLKLGDTSVLMVGCVSHASARVIYSLARSSWWLYVGATLSCVGPVGGAALKSMASKLIPARERGKVFVLLTLADNSTILVCVVIFSRIYNATILTAPHSVFWVTVVSQLIVIVIAVIVRHAGGGLVSVEVEQTETKADQ